MSSSQMQELSKPLCGRIRSFIRPACIGWLTITTTEPLIIFASCDQNIALEFGTIIRRSANRKNFSDGEWLSNGLRIFGNISSILWVVEEVKDMAVDVGEVKVASIEILEGRRDG